MSEDCRVGISLRSSSVRVCLVVVNQGCCSSDQYNRCSDLMIIQPYYSLLWLTLHIRAGINISHLSIFGIVAHGRCYISHYFFCLFVCFFKAICRVELVFFKCVINLTSFLFKSKFISFPICDSAHLLSHYYYCYYYYCYYYNYYYYYFFSLSLFSNAKISLMLLLLLSSLLIF